MERFKIADVFVGDFPISQYFGQNAAAYKKYGLQGHNGLDFALPMYTPILAGISGKVLRVKTDENGYGLYCQVWDIQQKIAAIYAHQFICLVKEGQEVSPVQVVGLSGNSGNSTGAHLHFGICPVDDSGVKTEANNGYAGYIDPLNLKRVEWALRDPTGIFANHFLH